MQNTVCVYVCVCVGQLQRLRPQWRGAPSSRRTREDEGQPQSGDTFELSSVFMGGASHNTTSGRPQQVGFNCARHCFYWPEFSGM